MEPSQSVVTTSYPVTFETVRPPRFDRIQVLVRILVLAAIGIVHQTAGSLFIGLYVLLPVVVAISVSQKGGVRFLTEDRRWLVPALAWVGEVYAFFMFVTDRFPLPSSPRSVDLTVHERGTPSTGSALMRLVMSLPHALVLAILGIASGVIGFVAAVLILFTEKYPESLHTFQRDVLAWMMRLLAYHASLVDAYPPFTFGAGAGAKTSDHGWPA
jgi:hypothetical protein